MQRDLADLLIHAVCASYVLCMLCLVVSQPRLTSNAHGHGRRQRHTYVQGEIQSITEDTFEDVRIIEDKTPSALVEIPSRVLGMYRQKWQ